MLELLTHQNKQKYGLKILTILHQRPAGRIPTSESVSTGQ